MKKVLLLMFVLGFGLVSTAQDAKAKKILDELSTKAKTFKTVTATFTKTTKSPKGATSTSKGKMYVKGKKYFVHTGEGIDIYCDSRSVWTHLVEDEECYKSSIEDAEDEDMVDPTKMFTIWEKDFKYRYVKEEKSGDKTYDIIYLHPLKPADKKFHKISIKIDRASKEIKEFIIHGKDGSVDTYKITTFTTNKEIGDSKFKFPKAKYPDVEVEES